jgi:hypothetical protein
LKYHPAQLDELERRRSLICEPPPPENVVSLPKARSLHAVLVENLNAARALLWHLEGGVTVPKNAEREIVRLLYVATRHQASAVLELDGLE